MIKDPFDFLRSKPNTLQYHLEHPGTDVQTYARPKRLALGKILLATKRIYLDTNHWLHLRDVSMGKPRSEKHVAIFRRLAALVKQGRAVCPISYSTYAELLRQNDLVTRTATARVIDKFGKRCCILPPDDVVKREFAHLARRGLSPSSDLYAVKEMVWTKVTAIVGEHFLEITSPDVPADLREAMPKAMDDLLWSMSLEEIIGVLGDLTNHEENREDVARWLTAGASANQNFSTFEQVFLQEVAGGLECYEGMLGDILFNLSPCHASAAEIKQGGKEFAALIYTGFKERRFSTELPGVHIQAGLHAAVRFDKKRHYKPGDCEDFRHAALALPYFDVFCTEKSLKHLLCHKPLEYDKAYKTLVVVDEDEVLEALAELEAQT
jgi:hypothetical protein